MTLYLGPVGLFLYVLSCKEPFPGTHERFIQPLWKQGMGSTIHCVAGDATGIIVAAAVTGALGLPITDRPRCQALNRRRRRLLATTETLERAMAPAAIIGFNSPRAANGMAAML